MIFVKGNKCNCETIMSSLYGTEQLRKNPKEANIKINAMNK